MSNLWGREIKIKKKFVFCVFVCRRFIRLVFFSFFKAKNYFFQTKMGTMDSLEIGVSFIYFNALYLSAMCC